MANITAVVLAAGLGTRMKTEIPKVLHEAGSRPLMERVINSLNASGVTEIIAVVGYKAELIEDVFKGRIRFVLQPELLGSGDAVSKALEVISDDGDIIVTCGDAPLITADTFRMLIEKHEKEKASCTFLTSTVNDPYSYGRIIRNTDGTVRGIVEEKDAGDSEKKIKEINAGTYCFRSKDIKDFIGRIELNEKKKEFYLTDIIEILRLNGKKIITSECGEEEIIGVNSRRDLAMVNKIVNSKTLGRLMDGGVTIVDPATTFIDESAEIAADTVIFPHTVIEKDVKISGNCRIGPFSRLRPGTRVSSGVEIGNFVELCRTEVNEDSTIKHHTYLGDTVVGKNVNIGAGTITANYDGKKKHRTIIEDNAFIGVGVTLIAPVKVGKCAKVGAGSVVTKNKDVAPGSTVVGVPAHPFNRE